MGILQGFTFKSIPSASVGLYLDTPGRTVKPATRINEYIIAGRDGTVDYGHETYEKVAIAVNVSYKAFGNKTLRQIERELALFFAGSGDLVFDDEPDKHYRGAKVVDAPTIEEIAESGRIQLIFEAQPFALGNTITAPLASGINLMDYRGTAPAPCLIVLRNDNDFAVNNVTITVTKKRS